MDETLERLINKLTMYAISVGELSVTGTNKEFAEEEELLALAKQNLISYIEQLLHT